MRNNRCKVYGRTSRINAIVDVLLSSEQERLPDICIDMMYSTMMGF